MKRFCAILLLLTLGVSARAQWTYGTSGLMNMPSDEMEENGTLALVYKDVPRTVVMMEFNQGDSFFERKLSVNLIVNCDLLHRKEGILLKNIIVDF